MQLIPALPIYLNSIALFGLVLLLGLVGGELASRTRLFPTITGYIFVGFIFGPGGLNLLDQEVLLNTRLFVDIALSLILFELGRSFDLIWFFKDKGLLATAISDSALTFLIVLLLLFFPIGMPFMISLLAATIAVAGSPAVILNIVYDLHASGPVTRRALMLTGFNNFVAMTIFTLILPVTQINTLSDVAWLGYAGYRFTGSIILGILMFFLLAILARFTGKKVENQFVLFVAMVILTLGLAVTLKLSNMITLFVLGVAARNMDRQHSLVEVNFSWLARIFFIILFVVIGIHLQLVGLWDITAAVMIYILGRFLTKTVAIMLFYRKSRLTFKQASSLALTMVPMAGIAIGMSNVLLDYNPEYATQLSTLIAAVVAVLSIIGPILTRIAFIQTGEAYDI